MLSLWIVISNKISILIYEIGQVEVGIKILSILYQYVLKSNYSNQFDSALAIKLIKEM